MHTKYIYVNYFTWFSNILEKKQVDRAEIIFIKEKKFTQGTYPNHSISK